MNVSFNSQILVDKLAKLNNTQQSIETLSHWCIFHRNKSKQVVDTWEKEFRLASRERKISFLYLANDILQNSRRKGMEFIAEFWRVLPGALLEVVGSGDGAGKNAALRLVDIWEERKVFGSRGQTLKEDILGKTSENRNKEPKEITYKSKKSGGEILEKLVSSYEHIHSIDEETLYSKCQTAVSFIDKAEKDKSLTGEKNTEELEAQERVLKECIESFKEAKLSRNNLIEFLKEALVEQELKIQQIDNQLQVANSHSDQANKLLGRPSTPSPSSTQTLETETLNPSNQTLIPSETLTVSEDLKSAAAAVAAKLAASTCSAQMLSLVFSSLASSETLIPSSSETLNPNPSPKRPKLDPSYVPSPPQSQPDSIPPPPPSQETSTNTGTNTSTGTVPGGQVQMMSAMGPMGGMVPWAAGSGPMFMPPMMVPPPFLGGPGPYQGFHGPQVGGPNQTSFTPPALPPLSRP